MANNKYTEIKVGLFVLTALAVLVFMSLRVGSGSFFGEDTYEIDVVFDSITGLKPDAPVEIAGIEVGRIKDIRLDNNRARLTLAIEEGIDITADSIASIKARGVLGDKFIHITPGQKSDTPLKQGETIAHAVTAADLEEMFQKVGQMADDISVVTKSLAGAIGGEQGQKDMRLIVESLRDFSVGINKMVQTNAEGIDTIVKNLRSFSTDLNRFSSENNERLTTIVKNFEQASVQMRYAMDRMNAVLTKVDSGHGAVATMINDKDLATDLKGSMASLQSVMQKIDEGQGSLGKLINDEQTVEELDEALEGINRYLAKQDTFKTVFDFQTEYATRHDDFRTAVNFELHPSASHYYTLGVVSDAIGRTTRTETYTQQWIDGKYSSVKEVKEKKERDKLLFNAQVARRWEDLVIRGGLFSSTGGVGLDYYLFDDRVKLFGEVYDFISTDNPYYRAGGQLFFLNNFYLTAGGTDLGSSDSSPFVGIGLRFTDDDFKYIMSGASVPGVK